MEITKVYWEDRLVIVNKDLMLAKMSTSYPRSRDLDVMALGNYVEWIKNKMARYSNGRSVQTQCSAG